MEGAGAPHKAPAPSLSVFRSRQRVGEGRDRLGAGPQTPATAPVSQRESLPLDSAAARPASRRATGIRNGEQDT